MRLLIPQQLRGEELAGLIYGTVTAMAVIAALADGTTEVWYMAGAAFGTSLVLAITFIYSHWLVSSHGTAPHEGVGLLWEEELPTLIGPFLIGVVMIAVKLSGATTVEAAEASMWVAVSFLFLVGLRIGRVTGRSFPRSVLLGIVDAAIGALIVVVKVVAH